MQEAGYAVPACTSAQKALLPLGGPRATRSEIFTCAATAYTQILSLITSPKTLKWYAGGTSRAYWYTAANTIAVGPGGMLLNSARVAGVSCARRMARKMARKFGLHITGYGLGSLKVVRPVLLRNSGSAKVHRFMINAGISFASSRM